MLKHVKLCASVIITLALTSQGCSGLVEETVEYDVFRLPTSDFEKMNFLGVAKAKGLQTKHLTYLISKISNCKQYQKTNKLNKTFTLPEGDKDEIVKSLKEQTSAHQDSRYIHGIVLMEVIKNKVTTTTSKIDVIKSKDLIDHKWFDSYGVAVHPVHNIYGSEEIAPKMIHSKQRARQKITKFDIGVRFIIFNKRKNVIIVDKTTHIGARLATYSKAPAIRIKEIQSILIKNLMERVARNACPNIGTVERTLYAAGDKSKSNVLVENGIDAASDGEWEKSADYWRKAILVDKKNPFAYHNLGVFYEQSGNVPQAMEEFKKSRKSRRVKEFKLKQYDISLDLFRPRFAPKELEPRVYGISGANWVSIYGDEKNKLKIGRTYSLFRSKRIQNSKFRVDGVSLIEMGRVKIIKADPPFMLGRVSQFINKGIETGDVVIVK
jgi:tetratricopeptide (TPR) repeat protein